MTICTDVQNKCHLLVHLPYRLIGKPTDIQQRHTQELQQPCEAGMQSVGVCCNTTGEPDKSEMRQPMERKLKGKKIFWMESCKHHYKSWQQRGNMTLAVDHEHARYTPWTWNNWSRADGWIAKARKVMGRWGVLTGRVPWSLFLSLWNVFVTGTVQSRILARLRHP